MVGLKERYDRRDAIALQSTLTGFHVEYEDGMRGEDVVTKALPPVSPPPHLITIPSPIPFPPNITDFFREWTAQPDPKAT